MKILVYSQVNAANIASSLGLPEYSYYFVLRDFLPALRRLGDVEIIETPELQVDRLYDQACAAGERCVFLSFTPPHKTPLTLRCPTVSVFAWEFDSIPNEPWLDELNQDWRYVLSKCGLGITHSELTVQAVKTELGKNFPIISVPSPVWDKYQGLREQSSALPLVCPLRIEVRSGVVLDTHDVALEPYMPGLDAVANAVKAARAQERPASSTGGTSDALLIQPFRQQSRLRVSRRYLGEWYLRCVRDRLLPSPRPATATALTLVSEDKTKHLEPCNTVEPKLLPKSGLTPQTQEWDLAPCSFELSGVVFTALFNPYDGRKNWVDMLTAFCAAFKDTPDATLLFKLGHHEYQSALNDMLMCMARMPAFRCRVVLLQGFLEGPEFDSLIRASAFVINASHGEGQCLPLMEFLSCGKPAIAPQHSAMRDYIDEDVAFIVDSWLDASAWSHDPRLAYRTCRHQIDWASLVKAYSDAYACMTDDPERYARMSAAAVERMRGHCSVEIASERLRTFLNIDEASSR
ncbi:glycosyltransferase [Pseudomonas sp. UBA2684]|uniref:glycosyltransferase n=1 Tax=Pseudomonas sp. UBA2684 TaxID=1947311 RepID=UPI000E864F26|nr:glycosyltransferase [Pseudomonas sp. UBA2684]HBX55225.1 glycosyltransferase [Pseudomonas sp.]|tara:strand:- start:13418 stop:14974 length:1557 start_codon:yes stop_codon:yes gene_type:complete